MRKSPNPIELALEKFVKGGVLLKETKDGEDFYIENPDFRNLPEKEQDKVFNLLKSQ